MLAVRTLLNGTKNASKAMRTPAQMQQRRAMSGGEDDGIHRVNWWDAPTNPNIWEKHQLAWWTVGIYYGVYTLVTGGKKEETK